MLTKRLNITMNLWGIFKQLSESKLLSSATQEICVSVDENKMMFSKNVTPWYMLTFELT